jgi:phosphoenolpyruvate carboxykinase (ATP)
MITAALNGSLNEISFETLPVFDLSYPTSCPDVPKEILNPKETWSDKVLYDETANNLASKFIQNFEGFKGEADASILAASPKVLVQ